MKIIDAHNHLFGKPLFNPDEYLDGLIQTMDKCGIEKTALSGLGRDFSCGTNDDVKRAMQRYPERILGAYYIRPGIGKSVDLDQAYADGFSMVKVTIPTAGYDSEDFYPIWEKAQELKMPVLFHTGVVTTFIENPDLGVNSWWMHPMRIEPICNAFPNLKVIVAHMGVHWNEDAAELVRMKKNAYVDLTGEPEGWRARARKIGVDHWLWWPDAFKKVIFGTDVTYNKIQIILEQDQKMYSGMAISEETKQLIFHDNLMNMLPSH